jgi:hypothetical protein
MSVGIDDPLEVVSAKPERRSRSVLQNNGLLGALFERVLSLYIPGQGVLVFWVFGPKLSKFSEQPFLYRLGENVMNDTPLQIPKDYIPDSSRGAAS